MTDSLATALFHHEFCEAYGVSADTFQFGQGYKPLGTESTALWSAIDPIPPPSVNQIAGSGGSLFSQNYGATLLDLNPKESLVESAQEMWQTAGGFGSSKGYTLLIGDVRDAITGAAALDFGTNTKKINAAAKASLKVSKVVTESGELVSPPDRDSKNEIVIDAHFEHVATFRANPLNVATQVGPLVYKGWYLNIALNRAHADKDGSDGMWKKPSDWDLAFGTAGSMMRRCTGLVIVDGYTYTITAKVEPSPKARGGTGAVAPAVTADNLIAGVSHLVPVGAVAAPKPLMHSSAPSPTSTQTFTSDAGNPVIFGFIVTPLPDYL